MPARLRWPLAVALIPLVALVAGGCAALYPPPGVTQQGQDIRSLYDIVFLIAAAIFLAVEGAIVFIVLRYRHRHEPDGLLPPQTHGHTGVEVLWTVIPFVIVAFLFLVSWQTLGRVVADPSQQAGVRIKVIASQWCWQFDYVDEGVTVTVPAVNSKGQNCRDETGDPPTMVVPVGERIRLQLHSVDVIHAFYVPQFVSKLDVVPYKDEARDNVFDFTPLDIGEYHGQCAEFCGFGHAQMQLAVKVVSAADYQAWIIEQKNKPSPSATPQASPPPPGAALEVSASTAVSFEQNHLVASAGKPFVVHFSNKQVGVTHNVWIKNAQGADVFQGPDVPGGSSANYSVDALPAGTYTFYCHIHPNMTGTLEVH